MPVLHHYFNPPDHLLTCGIKGKLNLSLHLVVPNIMTECLYWQRDLMPKLQMVDSLLIQLNFIFPLQVIEVTGQKASSTWLLL